MENQQDINTMKKWLFIFWDGKSKGTKHMIALSRKYNLQNKVFIYHSNK